MAADLRLMRYVIAIADQGGFARAAEHLHMAQPPLSRQIRDLERELGVQLFERSPTKLTEPGRVFVESARRILAEADRAIEATRLAGRGEIGLVRVGYTPSVAHDTLPALLASLRERHPGIEIQAREGWSADLDRALRDERFDVVLSRGIPVRAEFARCVLRREPLVVVVGASHPLAGSAAVSVRDLRGQMLCFCPRDLAPPSYDAVLAALRSTGETIEVWTDQVPEARHQRVRDGDGYTVVPRTLADRPPVGTVALPLLDELPAVELELVWKPGSLSASASTLIDTWRSLALSLGWTRS